jgi:membrane protease YdiL (CAAX protease family)
MDLYRALRAVGVAIALAVAGLGGGALVVLLVALTLGAGGVPITPALAAVLSAVFLQGVALGGVSLAYMRIRDLPLSWTGVRVPSVKEWIWAGSGYVMAILGAISLVAIVLFSGLTPAQNQAAELGADDPAVFLLLAVLAVVLIGPGEELLFRGVIQRRLRETFSAPVAIGLTTLIFASAHVTSLTGPFSGRVLTIALLFLPGLVFGVVYEYTRNVVVPALVHGAYNATLFLLVYAGTVLSA